MKLKTIFKVWNWCIQLIDVKLKALGNHVSLITYFLIEFKNKIQLLDFIRLIFFSTKSFAILLKSADLWCNQIPFDKRRNRRDYKFIIIKSTLTRGTSEQVHPAGVRWCRCEETPTTLKRTESIWSGGGNFQWNTLYKRVTYRLPKIKHACVVDLSQYFVHLIELS